MAAPKNKNKAEICGKEDLVKRVSTMLTEKVKMEQLNEIVEALMEAIKTELKANKNIVLKNAFTLKVAMSKSTVKSNPTNRQEKIVIPPQKRISFSASDNWKGFLNPAIGFINSLKKAKTAMELEKIYREATRHESYRNKDNAKRISDNYNKQVRNLKKGKKR